MATFGLKILRLFKERHKLEHRKRYKNLLVRDVVRECTFRPNRNYLYCPENFDIHPINISPFYLFELIPDTTIQGKDATAKTIYFLHFLNWAVYYYTELTAHYEAMPKTPKKEEFIDACRVTTEIAEMVEATDGKHYTFDEMKSTASNMFKKNSFPLKPDYFLKICRLFGRAWYEEHFCPESDARKSVEFGYFTGCYIQQSRAETDERKCKRYDGNSDYWKKEPSRLFTKPDDTIQIHFNHFAFHLERFFVPQMPEQEGGYVYTVRITQTGCRHQFDLIAKLHHHRYRKAKNKP